MSRTYRRKKGQSDLSYYTGDWVWWKDSWARSEWVPFPKDSKEYKRGFAKYRSDAATTNFKEPGPSWFRRLYSQRPYRQAAKREIQKYLSDAEYEPMILRKPKLEYWT